MKKLKDQLGKPKAKNENRLDEMGVKLPDGLESVGVITTEIQEFLPKPVTYNIEVQTQDYIDRPQTPLFTPVKSGEDKGTQIDRGDLFDFDEEVEPIINVLTFKTLEEARMEVLEEEELKEMKRQEQDFEKVRNRELEVVQKLENQERRRNEEKARRNLERDVRIKMRKVFQQKLISCVFAKSYLKNMKSSALSTLNDVGVLKKPETNEYQTKLLPHLKTGVEELFEVEQIVLDEVDTLFDDIYQENEKKKHIQSIENERIRKEEEDKRRQEELKRLEEEKIRRREERRRLRHEKELEELKNQIRNELLVNGQFVDDCNEIYNITGYHQKNVKSVQAVGGHIGQFAIILSLLKQAYQDIFNTHSVAEDNKDKEKKDEKRDEKKEDKKEEKKEDKKEDKPEEKKEEGEEEKPMEEGENQEKNNEEMLAVYKKNEEEFINKILDLYILKSHPFCLLYHAEDLEAIKEIDPAITGFGDIFKMENEENFNKIIELIINNSINNDELLPMIFESMTSSNAIETLSDILKELLVKIFKLCRTTTEFEPKEKIKFVLKEEPTDENYFGICNLTTAILPKPKPVVDITQQLLAKKAAKKGDKPTRPFFEPFFSEKAFVFPVFDDKMKILAFNGNYERIFRSNLIECICKLENKFETDKENVMNTITEKYNNFVNDLKVKLAEKYNKEILEINVEDPAVVQQNTEQAAQENK